MINDNNDNWKINETNNNEKTNSLKKNIILQMSITLIIFVLFIMPINIYK